MTKGAGDHQKLELPERSTRRGLPEPGGCTPIMMRGIFCGSGRLTGYTAGYDAASGDTL